jgi:hypothetical protein
MDYRGGRRAGRGSYIGERGGGRWIGEGSRLEVRNWYWDADEWGGGMQSSHVEVQAGGLKKTLGETEAGGQENVGGGTWGSKWVVVGG